MFIFLRASFLVSAKFVIFMRTMNNSTEGGTASPAAVHRLSRSQGMAYISAFVVEGLFILVGNLLVLGVFGKNRKLRNRKCHWLLINQAVADLITGLLSVINWVGNFVDLWDHLIGRVALEMTVSLLAFASFSNLVMIALERTHAAFRPIKHRALSARNYRVAILVVWLLPAPLACLHAAMVFGKIPVSTYFYILASDGCCLFLIGVFSYSCIWIKLKCSSVAPHNDLRAAQERKLTASVFLVTAASFMTFLSGMIFIASFISLGNTISWHSANHILPSAVLLYCVNYWINPIIYSLKMPGFRRAAIRLICKRRPRTASVGLPLRTVQRNRENQRL